MTWAGYRSGNYEGAALGNDWVKPDVDILEYIDPASNRRHDTAYQ